MATFAEAGSPVVEVERILEGSLEAEAVRSQLKSQAVAAVVAGHCQKGNQAVAAAAAAEVACYLVGNQKEVGEGSRSGVERPKAEAEVNSVGNWVVYKEAPLAATDRNRVELLVLELHLSLKRGIFRLQNIH